MTSSQETLSLATHFQNKSMVKESMQRELRFIVLSIYSCLVVAGMGWWGHLKVTSDTLMCAQGASETSRRPSSTVLCVCVCWEVEGKCDGLEGDKKFIATWMSERPTVAARLYLEARLFPWRRRLGNSGEGNLHGGFNRSLRGCCTLRGPRGRRWRGGRLDMHEGRVRKTPTIRSLATSENYELLK